MIMTKSKPIAFLLVLLLIVAGMMSAPAAVFADTSIHVHVKSGEADITKQIEMITVVFNDDKEDIDLVKSGNKFTGLDNNEQIRDTVKEFRVYLEGVTDPAVVAFDKNSAEGSWGKGTINYWITISAPPIPVYALSLTKSVDPTSASIGDTVTYTFEIINTGNTTLTGIELTDPLLNWADIDIDDLGLEGTYTTTAAYTIQSEDFVDGELINEAAVSATNADEVTASAVVNEKWIPAYELAICKSVSPTTAAIGDEVIYTLIVSNTGTGILENVELKDPRLELLTTYAALAAGDDFTVTKAGIVSEFNELGEFINTATAEASGAAIVSASAVVMKKTTPPPIIYSIDIDKSVSPSTAAAGDTVTYTIVIKNTGNQDLQNITVIDPMFNDGHNLWNGSLTPGAVVTLPAISYTIPAGTSFPLTNTAEATGWFGQEGTNDFVKASDSAVVNTPTGGTKGGDGPGTTTTIPDETIPEGPVTDEILILDEPVIPEGPALPQTGEMAPMIFYGAGALIAALGARLRKR